jgi:acyl carrier protein
MSRLTHIFSSVLGISEAEVTPELSPETIAAWDSLNAIILLAEIEKTFAMKFSYEEAMSVKNFNDVMHLIASRGGDPLL